MDTFDFPFHKFSTKYPESSVKIQFGKNWVFTTPPDAPDQRLFTLRFRGMRYYVNGSGEIDATIDPQKNAKALENFYRAHREHEPFTYPHPVYGEVTVRFNKPLDLPEGEDNADGMLQEFTIEFIEEP